MKALLMRRETPSLALLLVGAWIIRLALTGEYKVYVKDSFGPWLGVAGGLLVVAALSGLVFTLRGRSVEHDHGFEESDATTGPGESAESGDADAGHGHRSYVGWLLLVPLFAFVLIVPKPLGAYSAARAAGPPPPVAANYDALPDGDVVALPMREYTGRALTGDTMDGRTLELVGFVTPAPDGFYVTRLAIACCAADALPIKVWVATDGQAPAEGNWVTVTGTPGEPVMDETDSYEIASIEAETVTATAAPDSPYEQ
ncbi:TIGR03943 family putative permease subunit [Cumulibacter soli]|uniref:TIGR03943 family putative permease subunit n=1 Tax=Cumulibacter soli TaxID=2546344 RepID=UPI001068B527|nr:TIGR03943 family protein [Cumulibacter soli]